MVEHQPLEERVDVAVVLEHAIAGLEVEGRVLVGRSQQLDPALADRQRGEPARRDDGAEAAFERERARGEANRICALSCPYDLSAVA